MYYLSANLGAALPIATIAQDILADRITVTEYLDYLRDAAMINVVANYSNNKGKTLRKNKKYYITDCGVRNAMLKKSEFSAKEEGLLAETGCLARLKQLAENSGGTIYYYRDNGREVDFVLDANNYLLPIEVKYRNAIAPVQVQTVLEFILTNKSPYGLILTKDTMQVQSNVVFIPAWLI